MIAPEAKNEDTNPTTVLQQRIASFVVRLIFVLVIWGALTLAVKACSLDESNQSSVPVQRHSLTLRGEVEVDSDPGIERPFCTSSAGQYRITEGTPVVVTPMSGEFLTAQEPVLNAMVRTSLRLNSDASMGFPGGCALSFSVVTESGYMSYRINIGDWDTHESNHKSGPDSEVEALPKDDSSTLHFSCYASVGGRAVFICNLR